jgi:hypothetical protein
MANSLLARFKSKLKWRYSASLIWYVVKQGHQCDDANTQWGVKSYLVSDFLLHPAQRTQV